MTNKQCNIFHNLSQLSAERQMFNPNQYFLTQTYLSGNHIAAAQFILKCSASSAKLKLKVRMLIKGDLNYFKHGTLNTSPVSWCEYQKLMICWDFQTRPSLSFKNIHIIHIYAEKKLYKITKYLHQCD